MGREAPSARSVSVIPLSGDQRGPGASARTRTFRNVVMIDWHGVVWYGMVWYGRYDTHVYQVP